MNLTKEQLEQLGITDERKDFYFKVENTVVDEKVFDNVYEAYLFVVLSRYCNNNQVAFPSLNKLAEKCYCSKSTVAKYLNELENKGYIKRVQRFDEEKEVFNSTVYAIKNINKIGEDAIKGCPSERQGLSVEKTGGCPSDGHKEEINYKEQVKKKTKTKKETNKQLRKQQFEDWYNRYGCFDGNKVTAEKHFMKLSDEQVEKVNRYTDYYLTTDTVKNGYIKFPNNFLREKIYENPIPSNNKEAKITVDTKIVNRIGKIEMLLDTNNIIYEKDKLFLEETLTDDRYSKYRYILDKIDKAEIV